MNNENNITLEEKELYREYDEYAKARIEEGLPFISFKQFSRKKLLQKAFGNFENKEAEKLIEKKLAKIEQQQTKESMKP